LRNAKVKGREKPQDKARNESTRGIETPMAKFHEIQAECASIKILINEN
jgi:hypothetical protein